MAGLREEFTDKEESRVGGASGLQTNLAHLAAADLTDESSAQQKFKMRKASSIWKLNSVHKNIGRERLLSDFIGHEISDLENYQSNVEPSVKIIGAKFKFRP